MSVSDVLYDLDDIKEADSLGLTLNTSQFVKIILCGATSLWLSGAKIVSLERACLLGSRWYDFHRCQLGKEHQGSEDHGCPFRMLSTALQQTTPCFLPGQLEEHDSTLNSIMCEVTKKC